MMTPMEQQNQEFVLIHAGVYMCAMLAEKIRQNQNNQESEHQDEHIPQ